MSGFLVGVLYILVVGSVISFVAKSPIGRFAWALTILMWNSVGLFCKWGILGSQYLNKRILNAASKLEKGKTEPRVHRKVINLSTYSKVNSKK